MWFLKLQDEIQQLKAKFEKVEKERNELRLTTDRQESRVREMAAVALTVRTE